MEKCGKFQRNKKIAREGEKSTKVSISPPTEDLYSFIEDYGCEDCCDYDRKTNDTLNERWWVIVNLFIAPNSGKKITHCNWSQEHEY